MTTKEKLFIVHHCKNTKNILPRKEKEPLVYACNNCWIDVDTRNSKKPPTWKYCRECAGEKFDSQKPPKADPVKAEIFKQRLLALKNAH